MRGLLLLRRHWPPSPPLPPLAPWELERILCSSRQHTCQLHHHYSTQSGKKPKGKAAPLQERRMVDTIRVWAKGGDGGNGCWSIRRSRTDWRGKSDGGNGGRGGDVILECSSAVWDFSNLQHHLNANRGGHGTSKKQIGTRGSDKVVQVPVGTVIHLVSGKVTHFVEKASSKSIQPWEILETANGEHTVAAGECTDRKESPDHSFAHPKSYDAKPIRTHSPTCSLHTALQEQWDDSLSSKEDATQKNDIEDAPNTQPSSENVQYAVAELTEPNQRIIIACGGAGGLGNAYIVKTPNAHKQIRKLEDDNSLRTVTDDIMDDRSFDAQSSVTAGFPGTESVLILELKSIADVGLVGMPNVGKSTLLGAISRAKPAVGDYAFTTLRPNIGKLNYNDMFSVSVADIPGIIKGAHVNRGLGHAFLRHIERTKVLAYVVDLAATLDGRKGVPPWEQLIDMLLELEHHQKGLSRRPSLVVANKIDEHGAEGVLEELKRRVPGIPIFPVCAILEEGVPELKAGIRSLIDGTQFYTLTLDSIVADLPSAS